MTFHGAEARTLTMWDIQESCTAWFELYALMVEWGSRYVGDRARTGIVQAGDERFERVMEFTEACVWQSIGRVCDGLELYADVSGLLNISNPDRSVC
jgi:hypothetical protein